MDTTTTPSVPAPPATRPPAAPPSGKGSAPSRLVRRLAAAHTVPALASLAVAVHATIQWADEPDGFLADLVLFLTLPVIALVAPLLALTVLTWRGRTASVVAGAGLLTGLLGAATLPLVAVLVSDDTALLVLTATAALLPLALVGVSLVSLVTQARGAGGRAALVLVERLVAALVGVVAVVVLLLGAGLLLVGPVDGDGATPYALLAAPAVPVLVASYAAVTTYRADVRHRVVLGFAALAAVTAVVAVAL